MLNKSSLASTRQMHEFLTRLHPNDRMLLVGDRRQHKAVEAGKPFAQLQKCGMKTAHPCGAATAWRCGQGEHRVQTLVPRQDLTGEARTWAERYEVNDVLRYSRASKEN